MLNASGKTAIWGGAAIYQVWSKRLQVLSSYSFLAIAIAAFFWCVLLGADIIGIFHSNAVLNISFAFAGGIGVSVLLALCSRIISPLGFKWKSVGSLADIVRVQVVVESICSSMGVPLPEVELIRSDAIEVASVLRLRGRLRIIVTAGTLSELSILELEAVLAREIAKYRSGLSRYDALLMVPRKILALLTLGSYPESINDSQAQETMLIDLASLAITRFPPSLVSALRKIGNKSETYFDLPGSLAKGSSFIWLDPPVLSGRSELLVDRIAQLEEW